MHYDEQRKAEQYRVPKFSIEDNNYLALNYYKLTIDEMALHLRRTKVQIQDQLKALSLV